MAELIVALDVQTREEAVAKVKAIGGGVGFYKIGLDSTSSSTTSRAPSSARCARAESSASTS